MKYTLKTAALLLAIPFITIGSVNAYADELLSGKPVACAAVLPCDERGAVLPEYADGECGAVYAGQCAKFAGDQLNECTSSNDKAAKEISKLKRQNEKLRKRALALSRSAR